MRRTGGSGSVAALVVMAVLGGLMIAGSVGGGTGVAGATAPAEEQLIENGGFDPDVHVPWWWFSGTAFTPELVAGELCVEIQAHPREHTDPSVGQSGTHMPIVAGHKYVLSFDVAAAAPEMISVSVFDEARPAQPIFDAEIWPGTGMQHYKFTFYAPYATPRGGVVFRLGGMAGEHTVFLDNVSLIHHVPA